MMQVYRIIIYISAVKLVFVGTLFILKRYNFFIILIFINYVNVGLLCSTFILDLMGLRDPLKI